MRYAMTITLKNKTVLSAETCLHKTGLCNIWSTNLLQVVGYSYMMN